jgi:hypothetical protein
MQDREPIQLIQAQSHPQTVQFVDRPREMYHPNRGRRVQEGRLQDVYDDRPEGRYGYPYQYDRANRVKQEWVQQVGTEGRPTNRDNPGGPLENTQGAEGARNQESSRSDEILNEALKEKVRNMLLKAKHDGIIEIAQKDKKLKEEEESRHLERKKEVENSLKREK